MTAFPLAKHLSLARPYRKAITGTSSKEVTNHLIHLLIACERC